MPDTDGKGECGRLAPHGLKSRTQEAIEAYNQKQREARIEELETAFLARPALERHDPGVRVLGGEAEVVLHLTEADRSAGIVAPSVCFQAMHDSAHLAVASIEDDLVTTAEFTVKLTGAIASETVIARSVFVGMSDDQFMTESVLQDGSARELGRAFGTFTAGSRA